MYGPGKPPRALKHNAVSSVIQGPPTCRVTVINTLLLTLREDH